MSSPLAIAAVTVTMCDLLKNGLIDHDLEGAAGSFEVSALPPDRIETGDAEGNRLNLFLYQVTPNLGWRNEELPSHSSRDQRDRLSNPPLALDLHYLLTAYGKENWTAEILLGYAMEVLHVARVLTRDDIRAALKDPNPIKVSLVPADDQGRTAADLADQVEMVKICPHYLTADELSRMWTAMQARYRPSMGYSVSTVLIQGRRPVRGTLPVLTRGKNDAGVHTQVSGAPPPPAWPTLGDIQIVPSVKGERRYVAELGDGLDISGVELAGDRVSALFHHVRLKEPNTLQPAPGATMEKARFILPQAFDNTLPNFDAAAADKWPCGSYTVSLRIERNGKPDRYTDELVFRLAPMLSPAPKVEAGADGRELVLQFFPRLRPDQRCEVFVGTTALPVDAKRDQAVSTLRLSLKNVPPSEVPLSIGLRMDGVSNELIRNRDAEPPTFDPAQSVWLAP